SISTEAAPAPSSPASPSAASACPASAQRPAAPTTSPTSSNPAPSAKTPCAAALRQSCESNGVARRHCRLAQRRRSESATRRMCERGQPLLIHREVHGGRGWNQLPATPPPEPAYRRLRVRPVVGQRLPTAVSGPSMPIPPILHLPSGGRPVCCLPFA